MMKLIYRLALWAGLAVATLAHADYPDRPIRLVVPFAAGGNIDTTARIVATPLAKILGQPVVVENRAGAGGLVGSEAVARSTPDGYMLLLASSGGMASSKALSPEIKFDPLRDLVSAGPIARAPLVLVVSASSPIRTLADYIDQAKSREGRLSIASSGTGTAAHLTAELLQIQSKLKIMHVPYRGAGPAITDLLGGQVDSAFDQLASSLPHIQAGKLRALAITTKSRSPLVPNIPTFAESGFPDFESSTTTGLTAPTGTSPAVLQKLNTALIQVLRQPDVRQRFADISSDVVTGSGADFDRILDAEIRKWTHVVKTGNVQRE